MTMFVGGRGDGYEYQDPPTRAEAERDRMTNGLARRRDIEEIQNRFRALVRDRYGQDDSTVDRAFRWGVGDGFILALEALVDAAFPGWRASE